ncbi:MAG: cytochrome c biogenesis protein CcsA [Bacteroidota bacterium]
MDNVVHLLIGDVGHLFVILSFVSSLICAFAYLKARSKSDLAEKNQWLLNGRFAFYVHVVSVLGICVSLFAIISNHYFEYHYAYEHSDRKLPSYYLISTFWNGQEGSFLLWMFWQALLGVVIIFTQKQWEPSVMVIVALVQGFLASMIIGVVLPLLNVKIGSSPFILLRDAIHDPIFQTNPNFIPADGNGLNPLLQNYWMVIHPPTLFLGFALTLFPFAFCLAGLWDKKYTEWTKPALPWTVFCGAVLGVGILMGGIWAYETLNFGGYWNWDPVENAVYVPWLILIASMHTMITYKNSNTALKTSMILVISVFILILYSTFLTRSGILGDASVHSFTDLGLSGQLLIYLGFFLVASIVILVIRWKHIPTSEKEVRTYSREFWIFLGATILCLMGFQVLVPTSYPVWNKLVAFFGGQSNLATPADQIGFYSNVQLWFAVGVALVSGTGQFFWWRRMDKSNWRNEVMPVILVSLVVFAIIISVGHVTKASYVALALAGTYIIVSNIWVLIFLLRTNAKFSGGAVAHIGVGLMLIGIMFSAGQQKVVSLNRSGRIFRQELGTEFNRDNLVLVINEPKAMADYEIEYRGERLELRNKKGFVKKSEVIPTNSEHTVIAMTDLYFEGKKLYNKLDTFEVFGENTYYEIEFHKDNRLAATVFPRIQQNEGMGGFVASPDIKRDARRDIYTHVTAYSDPRESFNWSKPEEVTISVGQQFFVNDYVAVIEDVLRIDTIMGTPVRPNDIAVQARIKVQGEHDDYFAEPIFLIEDQKSARALPVEVSDLGITLGLMNIHPETNTFTVAMSTRQKNWVVIKAKEFPLINLLWLGTGVLVVGFFIALSRRVRAS